MKSILIYFRLKIQIQIQRILLQILSFTFTSIWKSWTNENVDLIKRSEFFSRTNEIDFLRISDEWSYTHHLIQNGEFHKANKLREEILEKIYNYHNVDDIFFPTLLCHDFLGPIGHKAFTGIHIMAQEIGLIPKGTRTGFINREDVSNNLLSLYKGHINLVPYGEGKGFTELPINWHMIERSEMIRGKSGFIEPYKLADDVFLERERTQDNSLFQIPYEQRQNFIQSLRKFGFSEDDWFVGIHIRDGSKTSSLRNQKLENYLPAIKEITDRGGWVIRIGGTEMPPMPKIPKLIDLVTEPDAGKELHLFVLSQAKFFIGTCSGPQYFPPIFGIPTLFTNQIGIGRSTLTFSKHSFHLPKVYLRNDNSRPSFTEMLSSSFGFGELTIQEYAKRGLRVIENSPEEIKEAVIEMFLRISGSTLPRDEEFELRINDIRSQFEWTSKGRISNSYLQANENWFIN
jgi:putative glycosyltransferase (TIGR04372 family)